MMSLEKQKKNKRDLHHIRNSTIWLQIPSTPTDNQKELNHKLNEYLARVDPSSCPSSPDDRIKLGYQRIKSLARENATVSVEEICNLHSLIGFDGIPRGPIESPWSENNIAIRGYHGAPGEDLQDLLHDYAIWCDLTSKSSGPLLKICGAYLVFELLHPFKDVNGRTGRLLASWMMISNGYGILAPHLEKKMGNENRSHGAMFESHINNYLAWVDNQYFHTYFMRFFENFLEELIQIASELNR